MTATRDPNGRVIRPPYEDILTGRSVRGGHGVDLAMLANLVQTEGGVSFALDDLDIDADGGGSPIYTRSLVRRASRAALYFMEYDTPPSEGLITLAPSFTPVNSTDPCWATGLPVDVLTTSRRAHRPLVFYERRDPGQYTIPSIATPAEIDFNIVWTGTGTIRIRSLRCIELPRRLVSSDAYGNDLETFDSRRPIFTSGSAAIRGGVQQLRRSAKEVEADGCARFLYAHYRENIATDADENYSSMWPGKLRVHPRRKYARDPGWGYASCAVFVYASNSATNGGRVKVVSEYDSTGIELGGFPIGSYGWSNGTISCYCEAGYVVYPWESSGWPAATPSVRGFQTGHAAGSDTDAEAADRTASFEDGLTVTLKGKVNGGDAANTLTVRGIFVAQL